MFDELDDALITSGMLSLLTFALAYSVDARCVSVSTNVTKGRLWTQRILVLQTSCKTINGSWDPAPNCRLHTLCKRVHKPQGTLACGHPCGLCGLALTIILHGFNHEDARLDAKTFCNACHRETAPQPVAIDAVVAMLKL